MKTHSDIKNLPPLSKSKILKGIIFIVLIIGSSITASQYLVPRMIAYSLLNGKVNAISSPELIYGTALLKKLPLVIKSCGIDNNAALKSIMQIQKDDVISVSSEITNKKDLTKMEASKLFLSKCGLTPFMNDKVYDMIEKTLTKDDLIIFAQAIHKNRFSFSMYLASFKIMSEKILASN